MDSEFDCKATAAVLRSGTAVALAGHAAALMSVLAAGTDARTAWIAILALLDWCVVVYLAIRVRIDAGFFELLAGHPPEPLDEWLKATGLRAGTPPRTMADRRSGALRLWRRLVIAVVVQIGLLVASLLWMAIHKTRLDS